MAAMNIFSSRKIKYFLFASIFISNINAQSFGSSINPASNLDPEFLQSLPADVQADLLDEINNQNDERSNLNFRSPQTRISKDKVANNKISLNTELNALERFGDNFFNTFQSTFMPVNEPSVSSSYILGIGDSVQISLLGPAPQLFEMQIARDGSISFLGLDKFFVAGLSLQEAKLLISSKIQDSLVGNDVTITLSSLRDIQVLLVGYIETPGQYILGGNSSLIHAISMAGGISDRGSFRKIKVVRDNEILGIFDIYNLLINGINSENIQLRSGDTILVEPSNKMVSIYGGVNRPAIYELKDDENFADLLHFSGGLHSLYSGESISLNTVSSSQSFETNASLNLENIKQRKLSPNDVVFVPYREINMMSGIKLSGNFSQSGMMSIDSAYQFLAKPSFLSSAYTLSFLKASFDQESNSYLLSIINQSDLNKNLNEGDKLYSLSKKDIEFINSKQFKTYLSGDESSLSHCPGLQESVSYLTPDTTQWTSLQIPDFTISEKSSVSRDGLLQASSENFDFEKPILPDSDVVDNDANQYPNNLEYCPSFVNFDPRSLALALENSVIINNYISNEYLLPISSSSLRSILSYRSINDSNKEGYSATVVDYNSKKTTTFLYNQFDSALISSPSAINLSYEDKFLDKLVYIEGAVKKPGNYRLQDHETLYDLILRAGGYKDDAYVFGASLTRQSAKERERQFNERIYRDIIKFLASSIRAANSISSSLPLVLEEFKNVEPSGRVQAEFSLSKIRENKNLRTSLENLDRVYIPKVPQEVFIYGEILNSGGQLYDPDLTVRDYIYLAGNTTEYSSKDIVIIDPNGRSTYHNNNRLSFLKDDLALYPGSIIYIPREIGKIDGLEYAQQVGPVFSSLALSLASLNQIFSD